MTDEVVNNEPAEQQAAPQPNMVTEEQLKGRLAQQARHHEKAMMDMQRQVEEMKSRLGSQAAQNVVDSGQQAQQPQYVPQPQAQPQPQVDVNQIKQEIMNSMQEAQQQKQAQEMQNRMNQQKQEVVNHIQSAQQEDPELQQMITQHQASMPAELIDDLYGEAKPAGVLKQLLANDDLRQQYQNAVTPLDRAAAIRRAALAFNTQVAGNNMNRRPGHRVATSRSVQSKNAFNASDAADLRSHYKDQGLY